MPKNGNITGQPFDPEVIDQINARQSFLGVQNKLDKHLIYQNNKTAFLRLASSVNIEDTPNITAQEILALRGIPASSKGSELAKKCVLFGGVVSINNESTSPDKPFGLVNSSKPEDIFSGAYGWGGIGSRGYVPMPGIESANVGFYNRGALAKADLTIKVYSVEQLQIFDLLYFRIGYTMLLEWGHSLYIDSNKNSEGKLDPNLKNRTDFYTKPFKAFFEKSTQKNIREAIQEERKKSFYNYDAMLGKVTNFTWKFNNDGSYDITLNLIGVGDIIEALKINTALEGGGKTISNSAALQQKGNTISVQIDNFNAKLAADPQQISFFSAVPSTPAELATLNTKWNELKTRVNSWVNKNNTPRGLFNTTVAFASAAQNTVSGDSTINLLITEIKNSYGDSTIISDISAYFNKNFGGQEIDKTKNNSAWEKLLQQAKSLYSQVKTNASAQEAESIAPQTARENQNKTKLNRQLYNWIIALKGNTNTDPANLASIPFTSKSSNTTTSGTTTLSITQYYVRLGYLLEYIESNLLVYDETKNPSESIININTEVENNFCLRFPYQVSADPLICIVASKNLDKNGKGWSYFSDDKAKITLSNYFVEDNEYIGKVMNIMVNIDFVARVLDSGVDINGKCNLLDFLKGVLNGINDALGNMNKLDAIYDGESNEIKIIEGSRLNKISEGSDIGVFEVYGLQIGKKGSFVTNVDFQVQLPPNMASMATISAQASGNIVGENATALSRLNDGLSDRIITTKLDASSLGLSKSGTKTDPEVRFAQDIVNLNNGIKELYKNFSYQKDNVDSIRSLNRDIASYTLGYAAEKDQVPAPFFIPFNLSLEMDGLSGMRNYERFAISENVLPYSYRTSENGKGVIDFLVKGISHTISNNQWNTKIESLTVSSKRKGTAEIPLNPDLSMLGNDNFN